MARNTGFNYRHGAIRGRSQTYNPKTDYYVKRDRTTGQFIDVKISAGPFKGVIKEG